MISRRDFLQASVAASAIFSAYGVSNLSRAAAQQSMTQEQLLDFNTTGNVTIIHITDLHAQLMPTYFREPEVNLGVGGALGLPPHLTGRGLPQDVQHDPRHARGLCASAIWISPHWPKVTARWVAWTVLPP